MSHIISLNLVNSHKERGLIMGGVKRTTVGAGILLVLGLLLVGGFVIAKSYIGSRQDSTQTGGSSAGAVQAPSRQAVIISIASSNTKQVWLADAVRTFNERSRTQSDLQADGRPVFVEVLKETIDGKQVDYRSGTMMKDTVAGKIKPTILSPGEESWIPIFKKDWRDAGNKNAISGDAPVLVRTPLVIGMWESRAKELGCWPDVKSSCTWDTIRKLASNPAGWRAYNRPEWGKFTFGYGYFGETNSGTLVSTAMCMAGVHKTKNLVMADVTVEGGCGQMIAGIEKAKIHSGKSDIWLLEKVVEGGPEYLQATVTYESNIIAANQKHAGQLREKLVSVYPQDGTFVVGHPFAILDLAPWVTKEQAKGAEVFRNFLLSKEIQEAVMTVGLRPADQKVKLASPIEPSLAALPCAKLVALEAPDVLVTQQLGEVWHKVKKKSKIVLLFDRSGSMGNANKIGAASRGAQEFVGAMDNDDWLAWMPFDTVVYADRVRGTKAEIGERLVQDISGINAEGGTALYDATAEALRQLLELRKKFGDSVRYGIVILSDGDDRNSRMTLAQLEEALKPQEHDPSGVQVHAICIGKDCDERTLQKIARAANGKYWKGSTDKEMIKIYREIATHY